MKDVILWGDALSRIKTLPDNHVHCIVTSPPYYGLRDYGNDKQIGLEETPEQYIDNLVRVFRESRRVLRDDGTLWLNLGDSYAGNGSGGVVLPGESSQRKNRANVTSQRTNGTVKGYKQKDLMMIPARVAMALQADGWYLRSQIIWHKPNAMPESVKDRPTNDYELVYLMSKSPRYYYDADKIREPAVRPGDVQVFGGRKALENDIPENDPRNRGGSEQWGRTHTQGDYRNKRAVWSISTQAYSEAHFAVMPVALADTCIKAGCPQDGIVLDPFGGAGTTAIAAIENRVHYILCELNGSYINMALKRIKQRRMEGVQLALAI